MKKIIHLFLVFAFFFSTSLISQVKAATFYTTADTYTKGDNVDGNYSTQPKLLTSNFDSNNTTAFLKFDLGSTNLSTAVSATLHLTPSLARAVNKSIHIVPTTNWSESTLTFQNQPVFNSSSIGQIVSTTALTINQPLSFSLSIEQLKQIQGNIVSLAITNTDNLSTSFEFYSKENGINQLYTPRLEIALSDREAPQGASPTPTPTTPGSTGVDCRANINGDDIIDIDDYAQLVEDFFTNATRSEIDGFPPVDLSDYQILAKNFFKTCEVRTSTPTPAPGSTATPVPGSTSTPRPTSTPTIRPTSTPTPRPTATPVVQASTLPTPTPIAGGTQGILMTPEQLLALPISGDQGCTSGSRCDEAWKAILAKANSNWGTINISVYNTVHPMGVMAGAIAAKRLSVEPGRAAEAAALRTKTIEGIREMIGTEKPALTAPGSEEGYLPIVRALPSYVVAADILGLHSDSEIRTFFEDMSTAVFYKNNGTKGNIEFHHNEAASNGNQMAGGARVTLAAFLNNKTQMDLAWLTFRRYTGDRSVGPNIIFNKYSPTWVHSSTAPVGINPVGAKCNNGIYPADGVIPNDQGRGGGCPTSISTEPPDTDYPWEGLQGVTLQAIVLDKNGYQHNGQDPWQINNQALLRAAKYQWYLTDKFEGGYPWYDSSRAAWVKHMMNYVYDYQPKYTNPDRGVYKYNASGGGRNFDFTQWLYQKN